MQSQADSSNQSQDTFSETSCSSAKNDTVQSVLQNDRIRYIRKGYGLFSAVMIFTAFFSLVPYLGKKYWNDYINLAEDRRIVTFVTQAYLPVTMFSLGQIMMYIIYISKVPFFERYRINNNPWPWESDPKKWNEQLRRTMKIVCFNTLVVGPGSAFLSTFFIGNKFRIDMESFPSYSEIMLQIIFFMIVEDFSFYWSHRILHTPRLYKLIHKKHHEFYNTVSIAAVYAHPIEYLLGNVLPTGYGFLILGTKVHFITIMMWLTIRLFETVDGHCGYEFSWSPYRLLPLSGSSEYHNYHHSHNIGVYASFFTLWDTVFGTNKEYYEFKAKKEKEFALNQLRAKFKKEKKGESVQEEVKKVI